MSAFDQLEPAGCSRFIAAYMGPAGVWIILDLAGDGSPDKLVSIVKRDLLTLGAGVVRPGNPICMSDLSVGVSEREITKGSDSRNSNCVSMGLYVP